MSYLLMFVWSLVLSFSGPRSAMTQTDWPQFRGPEGQGLATATGVPVHWSDEENVAWKTPIPGNGWSSPVVKDDRIYLTTAVEQGGENPISLRALSIDLNDGSIRWDVEVFQPDGDQVGQIHSKNSLASPTPIVRDGRLYVHFGHMGTAALDREGNILWKQDRIEYPPVHGNGGSPALVNDRLVFSCDGRSDPFVIALDIDSGDVVWKTPRNTHARKTFSFSTPLVITVDRQPQIILPGSGFVGSYDPQDGKERWRVRYGEGYSVVPRPVFSNGLIYVSSSFDSPQVYAINPVGAQGDATENHIVWQQRRGAPNTPSVLVVEDMLFMVSDGGVASCLDSSSGAVHWSERLGGNFSASPVAAEGRVYFLNETGTLFVVKADPQFEQIAVNALNERTLASPAVIDQSLLVRSEKHLWKISRSN